MEHDSDLLPIINLPTKVMEMIITERKIWLKNLFYIHKLQTDHANTKTQTFGNFSQSKLAFQCLLNRMGHAWKDTNDGYIEYTGR